MIALLEILLRRAGRLLSSPGELSRLLEDLHSQVVDKDGFRDAAAFKPNRGQVCETRYHKRVIWDGQQWIYRRADHADKIIREDEVRRWRYV